MLPIFLSIPTTFLKITQFQLLMNISDCFCIKDDTVDVKGIAIENQLKSRLPNHNCYNTMRFIDDVLRANQDFFSSYFMTSFSAFYSDLVNCVIVWKPRVSTNRHAKELSS